MTLLLKQLDIHGFKSFATPTSFEFDQGITAVIGPNGSGKSNVAEALRWVLGEQGYSNLRSRRTEDIIFAGSDKRAQLSMAEVVLTLDNRDGDLPLPFIEITVTRRAFRSGESQYLINGGRVRLKDIQQLVAPLGQSYTIIGQGLVDAALSQRPEERRGLFEHAAGISGLRLRANEAERSLSETSANAQRMRDILSELEPRVRSLERSARLAREYGTVRDRLLTLQRRHYGHLWGQSLSRLAATRRALREAELAHDEFARLHEQASRRLGGLRSEERRLADDHRQITEAIINHERELAEMRHRRALLDARVRAATQRQADLQSRIDELHREQAESIDEAQRHELDAAEMKARIEVLEAQLAEHNAHVAAARERRAILRAAIDASDKRSIALSRELAEVDGAQISLTERLRSIAAERERAKALAANNQERVASLRTELTDIDQRVTGQKAQASAIEASIAACDATLKRAAEALDTRQDELQPAERELALNQARLDVLERSHASGEGLYAGVRAVLRAINRGELQLPGLVGTLAETVEAPKELETAIEVALGGHLQDIVVAEWADAQAAIAYLQRANAGRATFQPLDTVRAGRRPAFSTDDSGVRGVAADLVTYPDQVGVVVEQLLGRTLVVSDLNASRRILASAPGWTLVTLAGEITRPSGSVTGGGRVAEAGLLARERERRALPVMIEELGAARTALQSDIERATLTIRDGQSDRQQQQSKLDGLQRTIREIHADRELLQRALLDAEATVERADSGAATLDLREQELDEVASELVRRRGALETERAELQTQRQQLEAALADEPNNSDGASANLSVELAEIRERTRTAQASALRARERAMTAHNSAAARADEIARLIDASATEENGRHEIDSAISAIEQQLAESQAAVPPVTAQRDEIVEALARADRDLNRAAESLREAERERDRATLNLARVQDEQVFLTERIRGDLDLNDPSELEPVDEDEEVPDEQEVSRLRERLRRMSNVGEDVLEQHESESQRLTYLSEQLADVDTASEGLRRVLSELNDKMATRFTETFREVAVAFEQTFARLFGGGSARLVMNASEDGTAGIDIVAQPPGKRLQNLNALSGGERALTAVALLIAIQRVNPSPFCLLDEVDAALDESNVVRFRDELRDLSGGTQYVVITHNRGTIEGADTLYGVTMGDDGISRVLSLRLEEAIEAVEAFETAQTAGG
ncbi:MAG TPA: chromosome segregation protein SMC [Thermomicrobiales bacterium]|nr:chromosome segregation protein SMC [Thermomicrobiales bacterium]